MSAKPDPIEAAVLDAARDRGPGKTICPSEAARRLSPDAWRGRVPDVHAAVRRLAATGRVVVTQRGKGVDPASARGPVRVSLPHADTGRTGGVT